MVKVSLTNWYKSEGKTPIKNRVREEGLTKPPQGRYTC